MLGSILTLIGGIFKPACDLVDNLVTSDEEKLTLRNQLMEMQFALQTKLLEYESKLLDVKGSIIVAEAKSDSWITRSFRPIVILTFTALIVMRWLGLTVANITPELETQLFSIVKLGLAGYLIGRSGEKIMKTYKGK